MSDLTRDVPQEIVPEGWEEPIIAPYLPKPGTPPPARSVAIVGTYAEGLNIPGKLTGPLFFPIFDYVLRQFGARLSRYENADEFVADDTSDFAEVAILVYREALDDLESVARSEQLILDKHPGTIVVHRAESGRVLGNKVRTNKFLTAAGIPVPRLIEEPVWSETVLSNHAHSSQQSVYLLAPGEALDVTRYNTGFVDTTHRFDGVDYYFFLRVYGVGETWIATYPGFRPVSEGNPAVHFQDPPDPAIINYFSGYATISYASQVLDLCRRMGAALGLGFYHYDLLPCRNTGRLFASEIGTKFSPTRAARKHLWGIRNEIPAFAGFFSAGHVLRAGYAFVCGARSLGRLEVI
jgi:hypothetical protein